MKPSQASELVRFALETDGLELFHSGEDAFAMVPIDGHRECRQVRSPVFRRWLARLHFENTGTTPNGQAQTDALGVLEGFAIFDGADRDVHVRVAEHDGDVYLDLADPVWRAVQISATGWTIVSDPPVRFRRPRGMMMLPDPRLERGGLDELRAFCNVHDDDWILFLGWLVGALRPRGPYPILVVHGEQGAAKSTLVRISRELVDPNEAPLRKEPRDGRDLIVAARNGHIVAFDNVSSVSQELSDDLARLATGAGFGARQLYTDMDEIVVHVSRPISLNGIEEFAVRGDLLDRALIMTLPPITHYRDEDAFWSEFRDAHPKMLGALLTSVSTALANHETTAAPNVRMADFARWVSAAESSLGIEPGAFVKTYRENRAAAVQLALEASPLSAPVQQLAAGGFDGTATDLLKRLNGLVDDDTKKDRSWPKRANTLSGRLRRLAPALRRVDVRVEFSRGSAKRTIAISRGTQSIVTIVTDRHEQASAGAGVTVNDDGDDESRHSANDVPAPGDDGFAEHLLDELDRGVVTEADGRQALALHERLRGSSQ